MNQRRRRSSKTSPKWILFLIALFIGCLIISGIAYGFDVIPSRAIALYGPPSSKLTDIQLFSLSFQLLTSQADLLYPKDPNGKEQAFNVNLGESAAIVAERLQDEGFIRSADAFRNYLVYSGLDTGLQAGNYRLSPSSTGVEIAHTLLDATPTEVPFNILPGWRIEEIAAVLPTSGLSIMPNDFITAVLHPSGVIVSPDPDSTDLSLEGFLLPGSYTFPREATLETILKSFVDAFNNQVTPDIRDGFQNQKLSLRQAVILASIVQKEAVVADEQPTIASVFLNRLAAEMKLDSDPTVQFALGYNSERQTWWTNPLTQTDLQIDSPYNTYLHTGLPPGPIANPGLSALRAVAFPAKTTYYYFRARCDGSGTHLFAQTLDEQIKNACP